ncbi:MAG: WecB/TagA/CpsF family glycosyltransferase [Candidatus Dormibacteria bacterium]
MPRAGVYPTSSSSGPRTAGLGRLELLTVAVDRCTLAEALERCESALSGAARPLRVVTLNPEMAVQAGRQPELAEAIRSAGLVLADGAGVVWASRHLRRPVPERIPGADFLEHLAATAATQGHSLFLLGGGPGVAAAAARSLERSHPGLTVSGCWAGSPSPAEANSICQRVQRSGASILAVAFGVPEQDLWLARHLLQTGCAVGIGVGGTFDYLAGRVPRAPLALRRLGLEWCFRLARQPWRLPRMLRGASFFWAVLRAKTRREAG